MPAVAIPAAVSLVGMAANAIGQHKQQTAQQKADAARLSRVQGVMDQNYADARAYQQQLQGSPMQAMLSAAMGPQTTTSSSNTTSDTEQSMDFGPEGNAARGDVLTAARNQPWTVQNALAGMRAGLERNLATAGRSQKTAIGNRAAKMGVDPGLMNIGADQALNAQRLNNEQSITEKGLDMTRQAYGDISSVLKNLFQTNKTHQKSRSSGTSTGPADYGAAAGLYNQMYAPVQREVAV